MKFFQEPLYKTYISDLQQVLSDSLQSIEELLLIEDPSWDSFITPYLLVLEKIHVFTFPLGHIDAVATTESIHGLHTESLPIISEWYNQLQQREDLYVQFQRVQKTKLTDSQNRFIEEALKSFTLQGIGLSENIKNRIRAINTELSLLENSFTNNIVKATASYRLGVSLDDVSEFPADELERNMVDSVPVFTLQAPSYLAYLKYGNNRNIRKELYKAASVRAPENGPILAQILQLKDEKSRLLGYKNVAELSLVFKMADSSDQVLAFLRDIQKDFEPLRQKEDEILIAFAEKNGGPKTLEPWDIAYFSEKYKKEVFDFNEDLVRPYFERHSVQKGLFSLLNQLFQLEFVENSSADVWAEDVQCFDVFRHKTLKARVYIDLSARDNKREGAWMNHMTKGYTTEEGSQIPVAFIVGNFTPSTQKLPSLLTHYEVTVLFHEMGHVLQHICNEESDIAFSGIDGIEWDAVEWSSQFLEGFCYEPSVLKDFARHYKTEDPLPDSYIQSIQKLRDFRVGNFSSRQTELGVFDMRIHSENVTTESDVQRVLNEVRTEFNREYPEWHRFQHTFNHIFGGAYSAGYYSYRWAEVLSTDAYRMFQSRGITPENGAHYYDVFLSRGSRKTSLQMFRDYMGRDPNPKSLIELVQDASVRL